LLADAASASACAAAPELPRPFTAPVASGMSVRAAKWQSGLVRVRGEADRAASELQRWELLQGNVSERAAQGTALRARVSRLKSDLDGLERELQVFATDGGADVCARELAQARALVDDLDRRAKASAKASAAASAAATPGAGALAGGAAAQGAFIPLAGGPASELQRVPHRTMLEQQREQMKDAEAGLDVLDGRVQGLLNVSRMVGREISDQNQMLGETHTAVDRATSGLQRTMRFIEHVGRQLQGQRWLTCSVVVLLAVLVFIFVYIVLD